jgi:hypothetical protein
MYPEYYKGVHRYEYRNRGVVRESRGGRIRRKKLRGNGYGLEKR